MNRRTISVVGMLGWSCLTASAALQEAPPVATFSAATQTATQTAPAQIVPLQSEPLRIEVAPASSPSESAPRVSGNPISAGLRPMANEPPAENGAGGLVDHSPVQTVSYESPLPSQAADQMLQLIAARPGTGDSMGVPLSLREAMRQAPGDQRLPLTRAYWRCFEAQAKLESARFIESQVVQLSGGSTLDGPLVQAERAMAAAEIAEAESALRDAQVQLVRYMPSRPNRALPLPSSLPLVSEYVTNYETLAAPRGLDPRLQGIDLRLVEGLANLTALAESAWQTRDLVARFISAFHQQQKNLAETMYAIGACRRAHDAFYHAVAAYNQDIASYAFAVAPPSLPADQAVAMLIKVDREPSSNSTRQADATSVLNSGTPPTATPNTNLGALSIDPSAGSLPSSAAATGTRFPTAPSSPAGWSNGSPPIVSSAGNRTTNGSANSFPGNPESAIRAPSPSPFSPNSLNSPATTPPPMSTSIQLGSPSSTGGTPPSLPPGTQPPGSQQTPQPKPSSGFPILGR